MDKRCVIIDFVTDYINGKRYGLSECIPTHHLDILQMYSDELCKDTQESNRSEIIISEDRKSFIVSENNIYTLITERS